ncbi:hypothetical protein F5890DRAFT_1558940 [Lentinula detonsa]|uniref:Uncharacterized protein n=1 Tax=Lentinula detonsa TaxID=2804962 RepID=A0AA38PQA3_9AGAR|nr:hypothetical protein F5890DRAFT_1558940 [Lentinula detonsa]
MNITEGTIVARELPEVIVAFIWDEEFEPYRKKYPAPFSEDDIARNPIHNRLPLSHGRETYEQRSNEPPPQRDGSERPRRTPHNNRFPLSNSRNGGGGGGPPEPSDDGGAGDDNKDDRFSQHPTEEMEPRIVVPDKFNPRSLTGIGETYSYEPKTVSEEECLNEILRAVHAETERLEKLGAAERRSRRQEKENQRLELSRSEYHNRWKLLLSNTSADMPQAEIRFDDIPWPILPAFKKNEISTFLFTSCVPLADPSIDTAIGETISLSSSTSAQRLAEVEMAKARKDRKEKLRETLLCFHPDKFEGRLMSRVRPDEKVKVTEALAIIEGNSSHPRTCQEKSAEKRNTTIENHCLAAFIEINGVKAFALFDSGSTADAISPDFARVAHGTPTNVPIREPSTTTVGHQRKSSTNHVRVCSIILAKRDK